MWPLVISLFFFFSLSFFSSPWAEKSCFFCFCRYSSWAQTLCTLHSDKVVRGIKILGNKENCRTDPTLFFSSVLGRSHRVHIVQQSGQHGTYVLKWARGNNTPPSPPHSTRAPKTTLVTVHYQPMGATSLTPTNRKSGWCLPPPHFPLSFLKSSPPRQEPSPWPTITPSNKNTHLPRDKYRQSSQQTTLLSNLATTK